MTTSGVGPVPAPDVRMSACAHVRMCGERRQPRIMSANVGTSVTRVHAGQ